MEECTRCGSDNPKLRGQVVRLGFSQHVIVEECDNNDFHPAKQIYAPDVVDALTNFEQPLYPIGEIPDLPAGWVTN